MKVNGIVPGKCKQLNKQTNICKTDNKPCDLCSQVYRQPNPLLRRY